MSNMRSLAAVLVLSSVSLFACASSVEHVNVDVGGESLSPTPQPTTANFSSLWVDWSRRVSPQYKSKWTQIVCPKGLVHQRVCTELTTGIQSMLGASLPVVSGTPTMDDALVLDSTADTSTNLTNVWPPNPKIEGFEISSGGSACGTHTCTRISSSSVPGALRGVLRLLLLVRREVECGASSGYTEASKPGAPLRIWDLWDNRDGSVERGYGGKSVFEWLALPTMQPRYTTYARLLASVGINAIVWDNVNACGGGNQDILQSAVIASMQPLVELFYEFGIHSFVTPCYSSPIIVGNLTTADPYNPQVAAWWATKAVELRTKWDGGFRGFLIKADCEGQPGPTKYNRTELEAANALATALAPVDAIIIWRAFAHPPSQSDDQALFQFDLFKSWQGMTLPNVVLQCKNGPFDFQVREPVHSLFSFLSNVSMIVEFEATQEYLGQGRHLAHLPAQWESYLTTDLYFEGKANTTLAGVISGEFNNKPYNGIAAVSNLGNDFDWTGGAMSAANTYGFGRLAWEPASSTTSAEDITQEWVGAMFGTNVDVMTTLTAMLMTSWRAYENYTSSLGWGFSCSGNHYDMSLSSRQNYINASNVSVGYNRGVPAGFGATYNAPLNTTLLSAEQCPDVLLLCFHNVPYDHVLHSGQTVIEYIYESHDAGAAAAQAFVADWESLQGKVDLSTYGNQVTFDDISNQLQNGATDAATWSAQIILWFKDMIAGIKPTPPPPPPPPGPPSPPVPVPGFTLHSGAFCKAGTNTSNTLADRKGLNLTECVALCDTFGNACACFDYKDSGHEGDRRRSTSLAECRAKRTTQLAPSSIGFTAYVRN
eukprot:m.143102 g.143102  ORF g.143102 m.143102 type:complete len:825 (-) comp30289_c0_seq1:330-2804(-)